MKKIGWLALLLMAFATNTNAQDWGIKFGGYLKTDMLYNTRKSVDLVDGEFYLYPERELLGIDGVDINAKPNFNMFSFQSRLQGKISAPDFLGAKVNGFLEADFLGNATDLNTFRLRVASINLDWGNYKLLIGQYWNPLYFVEAAPNVVQYNGGAPYIPFARNPQVRFSYKPNNDLEFNLTAMSQRDFKSLGPKGNSNDYLKYSPMPTILNVGALYHISPEIFVGANGQYKLLKPKTTSSSTYEVNETIGGVIANAVIKVSPNDKFYALLQASFAQNANDLMMIGGFISSDDDFIKKTEKYTPTNTFAIAFDSEYGSKFKVGLFAGYSKNLGFAEEQNGTQQNYYIFGAEIGQLMRISPRIMYRDGNVQVATEFDYSKACYGAINPKTGIVENANQVSNLRVQLSGMLFF